MPWVPRATLRHFECQQDLVLTTLRFIDHTLLEIKKMATNAVTQEQFTADLATLNSNVTTLTTAVTNVGTYVQELQAQIAALQAANPAVDFSVLDSTVNAINTEITTANTSLAADVPAPVVPPATPAA